MKVSNRNNDLFRQRQHTVVGEVTVGVTVMVVVLVVLAGVMDKQLQAVEICALANEATQVGIPALYELLSVEECEEVTDGVVDLALDLLLALLEWVEVGRFLAARGVELTQVVMVVELQILVSDDLNRGALNLLSLHSGGGSIGSDGHGRAGYSINSCGWL